MGCVYSRACIGEICVPKDGRVKEPQRGRTNAAEIAVFSPTSSNEGEETRDQIHSQLSLNLPGDQELGITRLSRVSSQFLPADGSRAVKVPSGNYELKYSYLSQRGYYPDALDKANQDSFCIHTPFGTNPDDHFFGVFDGHGEFGAECSQFVKRKLCENLLRSNKFHVDAIEACHAAYLTTNTQLHADSLDDSMSGTTAITVLVRGRKIYVANSGDSRAVIAEKRGKEIVAVDLSIDQTPFRVDELERVKLSGARVLTLDQIEGLKNPDVQCWGTEEGDDGDPPRLWVPNGMYPGTAFTRSIGDSIAETIGVVANPEIVMLELTEDHPFFVLASDGVFEFLSSQTVVDMVAKHNDPRDACAAIVAESYRLWLQYETRTDDITVIVVHINGLVGQAGGESANPASILRPPVPQVSEATGSESPLAFSLSSRNQQARHDLSRARLRAIESSLENGQIWVPPPPAHRKTWEEEAHIERALHDHFLFRKLTDSQRHVLLDCMQRIEVQPGDTVVKQGGEGDCFYVVGSGEFEVLATQEDKNGAVPRVLQRYTADKLSSFGELALMYNKPLQASVLAVTSGTLWALKREDFRGILMSEFSNLSSLKLLRSVDLLSRLTILQLSHVADSLFEVSFSNGQTIFNKNEGLSALHIIQKGQVRITFDRDLLSSPNVCSLKSDNSNEDDDQQTAKELSVEKTEGSYFGEWTLLGEQMDSLSAVAVGDVMCAVLTKEKFDSVVGPLTKLSQDDQKIRDYPLDVTKDSSKEIDISSLAKVSFTQLEWRTSLYSTDCSEIGLVLVRDSEKILSLKRFSKQKVKKLGKEAQVLKEKGLMKSMSSAACMPEILCTCADQMHAGILLNTYLVCPLASILHTPLDEQSARFCAASVVTALEDLHENGVLYRGVSPDVLMLNKTGHLQLVDFRFGKKLSSERTFTICGMADSLAPEVIQGKGHGLPADWWSLGVLIYFLLQGEMPFGSWRQSELDTFAKIAKGQFTLSQNLSPEAVDLITKLLEVDENVRLGCHGSDSVKNHPWFDDVDWRGIRDQSVPVPHELTSRISQHLESHNEECPVAVTSPTQDIAVLNDPEWLDEW
ncbi:protein phosphatase 2C and cyclic nucleotide-binding/kinase domain-containing protein-like isoform X1 [Gossypium arboreum]|nr:protein phosphatase 2C and cyclic nucleotide-binding/kinase domain-containing protein-like isoform X1 [Gossypium arboreum]XP_052886768.1 protein phosphatase 2C and cyclic nucleotide-binding/kinase domain-containing protein-like isoform X1 [Gossypium arboreum]XP_052886769.1 protein phosphatase 2C and cyclic nucleotide-binding/kinase domain-containing protein-like isoform X1 [Gossypium arboreum]XP_052886770.1 protein phosphatase 2C and cyclic nucleotide-binding/kinase domain-containing protein-